MKRAQTFAQKYPCFMYPETMRALLLQSRMRHAVLKMLRAVKHNGSNK